MTAIELADELGFKHIAGDDNGAFSSKIITMLRQQAEEIEYLKAELEDCTCQGGHSEAYLKVKGKK